MGAAFRALNQHVDARALCRMKGAEKSGLAAPASQRQTQKLFRRHRHGGAHRVVEHALDVDLAAAAFGGDAALRIDRIDRRRAARGDVIDGSAHVALADAIAVADEHLNPKRNARICERIAVSLPEAEPASQSHPQARQRATITIGIALRELGP